MLIITIYCFKKKSEINFCFLLNTYSFSTLKFSSLIDLIIASPNLEQRLKLLKAEIELKCSFSMLIRYFLALRKGKQYPCGEFLSPIL